MGRTHLIRLFFSVFFCGPNFKYAENLIEVGADVNKQDYDGNTAAHWFMKLDIGNRRPQFKTIYDKLVGYGDDLTIENDEGLTPLQVEIIADPNGASPCY